MRVDYKVRNGKLLRLEFELDKDIIKKIKINGDFFIYPETAITEIENILVGCKVNDCENILDRYLQKKNIKLIGISPVDVKLAIDTFINARNL